MDKVQALDNHSTICSNQIIMENIALLVAAGLLFCSGVYFFFAACFVAFVTNALGRPQYLLATLHIAVAVVLFLLAGAVSPIELTMKAS